MNTSTLMILICGVVATSAAPSGVQVINGENAVRGEFPYQVRITGLSHWNITMCTGALVETDGKQFVLTSGKCADSMELRSFWTNKLIMGELRDGEWNTDVQIRLPNRAWYPEDYDWFTGAGNIAIIGYEYPFDLTDVVQPIKLPTQGQNTTGDLLFCGWGGNDKGSSKILQKITLSQVSDKECAEQYRDYPDYNLIESTSICARAPSGRNSHCLTDVGGPAVSLKGEYLAGLASWPEDCELDTGGQDLPEVYVDVAKYIDWIKASIIDL